MEKGKILKQTKMFYLIENYIDSDESLEKNILRDENTSKNFLIKALEYVQEIDKIKYNKYLKKVEDDKIKSFDELRKKMNFLLRLIHTKPDTKSIDFYMLFPYNYIIEIPAYENQSNPLWSQIAFKGTAFEKTSNYVNVMFPKYKKDFDDFVEKNKITSSNLIKRESQNGSILPGSYTWNIGVKHQEKNKILAYMNKHKIDVYDGSYNAILKMFVDKELDLNYAGEINIKEKCTIESAEIIFPKEKIQHEETIKKAERIVTSYIANTNNVREYILNDINVDSGNLPVLLDIVKNNNSDLYTLYTKKLQKDDYLSFINFKTKLKKFLKYLDENQEMEKSEFYLTFPLEYISLIPNSPTKINSIWNSVALNGSMEKRLEKFVEKKCPEYFSMFIQYTKKNNITFDKLDDLNGKKGYPESYPRYILLDISIQENEAILKYMKANNITKCVGTYDAIVKQYKLSLIDIGISHEKKIRN